MFASDSVYWSGFGDTPIGKGWAYEANAEGDG